MDTKHEEKIRQIALPLVQGLGLTLWGIQCFMAGKKTVLSVFVDTPNAVTSLQSRTKEERDGINLDQCAQVSRDLGLALEVEDIMSGAYRLEVSSPGLERRFFSLEQMKPYIGRKLKVELESPVQGRKNFTATLETVDRDAFIVTEDKNLSHRMKWSQVRKVRLVHEF